jgi:hypothetical protein
MGPLARSNNGHGAQRLSINSRSAPPAFAGCGNKKPCLSVLADTKVPLFLALCCLSSNRHLWCVGRGGAISLAVCIGAAFLLSRSHLF